MEQIRSFQIDHRRLERGLYLHRQDTVGDGGVVTTFDIRVCKPYCDFTMDGAAMHTIEHLGATFLRTESFYAGRIVYFGPMGCGTGFYLIVEGDVSVEDISGTIRAMFAWIATYDGPVPGATEKECGNADFHDLDEARRIAHGYYNEVLLHLCANNTAYPADDNNEPQKSK